MKTTKIAFGIVSSCLLLIVGCVVVETDVVCNNTGQTLAFTVGHAETNWTTQVVSNGGVVEFHSPYIEIGHAGGVWRYDRKPLALEFYKKPGGQSLARLYKNRGGSHILVKLQIEHDGAIYVVLPDSESPAKSFPVQPEGFPLKPLP